MWRWVTRCLVLTLCAALFTPALFAQAQFAGDVDLPDPSRIHSGFVFVRGWALDPGQVTRVELYVDDQFQQVATTALPRIDVEEAFPNYPGIQSTKPGFETAFRASRFTNGPHTIEMRVYTSNGDVHFLGRRTITINNSINQAPVGALDIPDAAGVKNAVGSFPVLGWAIDTDGIRKVEVQVDGAILQNAIYGDARPDVGGTYADYPQAMLSGYVAQIDTTRIQNGVHTISVVAYDNEGTSRTIGRRTVQVINNDLFLAPFGYLDEPLRDAVLYGTTCDDDDVIISPPVRPEEHITPIRGWALDLGTRTDTGRVAYAELLIDGVSWLSTDDCAQVFGGFANCYGFPRYDVARYYPTYPDALRSGFLFTLDVGALIVAGVRPGNHTMKVRVGDREQTFADLPNHDGIPVWFQCAGSGQDFPAVGFIDFPTKFDYVGGDVVFRGWALDENSGVDAVQIVIDGTFVGTAQYGFPRPDIDDAFPQEFGAINSGWAFTMDTRKLGNTRHRLTVRVVDGRGRTTELGSVDFYVQNNQATP